jgi:hypothetical protein
VSQGEKRHEKEGFVDAYCDKRGNDRLRVRSGNAKEDNQPDA